MSDDKLKVSGIIDNYSRNKGSVMIDNVWYGPDKKIENETITRANSGEFRKGLMAVMELTAPNVAFFKSIEIMDPKSMSVPEVAKAMNTGVQVPSVVKSVEKFGMIALTEENFEEVLTKGKLMLKLAKALRDDYMNASGRTELKEAEFEMINSVLKALLWGK